MSDLQTPPTTTAEIREAFLSYFERHGHHRVASSSLVPGNDPTLLFTNAGMVQFKDVFLGDEKRDYQRATSSQRCVRAGGKHNDLENVGYTARHHTFFEMLGNFSFGDYFKKEAIPFGWNFLTQVLQLPAERLYVTVYAEDDEAYAIWLNDIGLPADRIIRIGDNKGERYASDNFWAMGDTGPCGPCTEIFYDHGEHIPGGLPGTPEEDGDRYIEVWNIVFMQFNRGADGELKPLPKPSVDTGMGLERIAAVMQHVNSNYQIDLFERLLQSAADRLGVSNEGQSSLCVVADHIRSCAFLISDGVQTSNEGRGYVLRRIVRRAVRHGNKLSQGKAKAGFFADLVAPLTELMGEAYPELVTKRAVIEDELRREESQFAETLDQGMRILEQGLKDSAAAGNSDSIQGELAFRLYDTYGFPLDLTQDIARERNLTVDVVGYERCMQEQREKAKAASSFKTASLTKLDFSTLQSSTTEFTGYQATEGRASVLVAFKSDALVDQLQAGDEGILVLDSTPFYAESGGQVGDKGLLRTDSAVFQVLDTQKQGDTYLHQGVVQSGSIQAGDAVVAEVGSRGRLDTARHHSATHLLHAALRQVLGEHVTQKGSYVDAERLRFDFSNNGPVSQDDLQKVSDLVSANIRANTPVETELMSMDSAKAVGAMALFGEKYADEVRVLSMGMDRFSVELCGGTHVSRTGDIGSFYIVGETGIASGVRRIEALVGEAADQAIAANLGQLQRAAELLKAKPEQLLEKMTQLLQQQKQTEKKLAQMQQKLASSAGSDLVAQSEVIADTRVLLTKVESEPKALRSMIDQLKQKLGSAIVVLVSEHDGKLALVAGVSDDRIERVKAGDLIKQLAGALGGKGGGKPQFAQGGGSDLAAVDQALRDLRETIVAQLG